MRCKRCGWTGEMYWHVEEAYPPCREVRRAEGDSYEV